MSQTTVERLQKLLEELPELEKRQPNLPPFRDEVKNHSALLRQRLLITFFLTIGMAVLCGAILVALLVESKTIVATTNQFGEVVQLEILSDDDKSADLNPKKQN